MNPVEIDDVLEVPAHQYTDSTYSRDGDVLRVGSHSGGKHRGGNVRFREFVGFCIKLEHLNVFVGDRCESATNLRRCRSELLDCEAG